jgi:tetratricopeptide (TPR) repeat protein
LDEVTTDLSYVSRAAEAQLQAGEPEAAAALARVILLRYPRHLATYQRLLRAAWMLRRWQEGEDWARRLLQADPGNALAWRSLAYAVELKEMRNSARAMWRRAFEADPYEPEIRAGLSRTSLERPDALMLNPACLASLYLRGGRWAHAAAAYRGLVQSDERRLDYQVNGMVALWQQNARQEAYRLARHLTRHHPYMLLAWVVLSALGDIDDKALARNPIGQMDPDGDYVRSWLGLPYAGARAPLQLTAREAALVAEKIG